MKRLRNGKIFRIAFLCFGAASIGASILHLVTGHGIPGVEPLVSAAFLGVLLAME